jgi:hypothetical protein
MPTAEARDERPSARGIAMDECNRAADLLVAQCAEPAGLSLRIRCDPRANRLDHQNIGKASDDRFAACSQLARLAREKAQRALQPFELR